MSRYFDHLAHGDDNEPDEPQALGATGSMAVDQPFLQELVCGVAEHRQELDEIVQNMSRNWRIERMALVERNVIRVALFEMRFTTSIPTNVAINEAVELAKRFGTAEGAAFVNGLLDRAATELQLRR
jgi:N utilization substance protein B